MGIADHPSAPTADPLMVIFAPEDAGTAFAAGVQFARALAGAEGVAFLIALGEQQALIRADDLGSGLIDHSQKMTAAAIQIADMKVWAQRS